MLGVSVALVYDVLMFLAVVWSFLNPHFLRAPTTAIGLRPGIFQPTVYNPLRRRLVGKDIDSLQNRANSGLDGLVSVKSG